MSNTFFCPQCRASLNPGTKVIVRIQHGEKQGLALLSPQVGNYTTILPENFDLTTGQQAFFSCPVCGSDFTSAHDDQLSEVLMAKGKDDFMRVNFSRTYGQKATFVVTESQVHSFGTDAELYLDVNFFGAGRQLD